MLTVDFYKLDAEGRDARVGSVTLDADGDVDPDFDSDLLQRTVLKTVVLSPSGVRATRLGDPRAWISGLYRHYKSAYLRASRARKGRAA